MPSVFLREPWKMMVLLLACLAIVAVVACQFHAAPPDHEETVPSGHHHPSSPHLTLDLHCLIAVLPLLVFPALFSRFALYVIDLLAHPTAPVFPPFMPPEDVARA
jgi:hypothetical protein